MNLGELKPADIIDLREDHPKAYAFIIERCNYREYKFLASIPEYKLTEYQSKRIWELLTLLPWLAQIEVKF